MPVYAAFNCIIDSDILLPAIFAEASTPELVIRRGGASTLGPDAIGHAEYIQTQGAITSINIPTVARFYVRAGREIIVDAYPGVDDEAIRVYLLGLVIGVALMQRGFVTLHAGAVAREDRALAFVGSAGAGKSTLTAFFCSKGYRLLSEDLLALRRTGDDFIAWPGFPRLKLTDEASAGLDLAGAECESVFGKQVFRMDGMFQSAPARLDRIFLLEIGEPAVLETCDPKVAAGELIKHWFGTQYGGALIHGYGPGRLLAQAVEVARRVPVRRLQRPLEWDAMERARLIIEKDLD